MRIYTKTGDKGKTALVTGGRRRKDDRLIETYGTLDELNACVGVLLESLLNKQRDKQENGLTKLLDKLERVQRILFVVGTEVGALANPKPALQKLTFKDVQTLEEQIDSFSSELPVLQNFILPSGNMTAAYAHLCRTVCRRAERRLCRLVDDHSVRPELLAYLNRLSDWFFTVARLVVHQAGDTEKLL